MNRRGIVYVQETPAGLIEEFDGGFRFSYLESYIGLTHAAPVSFTLPLRREPPRQDGASALGLRRLHRRCQRTRR